MSPANVPIFQFKTVMVAAGILLFIQGMARSAAASSASRPGKWPEHAEDVEELEAVLLKNRDLAAIAEESHALPQQTSGDANDKRDESQKKGDV